MQKPFKGNAKGVARKICIHPCGRDSGCLPYADSEFCCAVPCKERVLCWWPEQGQGGRRPQCTVWAGYLFGQARACHDYAGHRDNWVMIPYDCWHCSGGHSLHGSHKFEGTTTQYCIAMLLTIDHGNLIALVHCETSEETKDMPDVTFMPATTPYAPLRGHLKRLK